MLLAALSPPLPLAANSAACQRCWSIHCARKVEDRMVDVARRLETSSACSPIRFTRSLFRCTMEHAAPAISRGRVPLAFGMMMMIMQSFFSSAAEEAKVGLLSDSKQCGSLGHRLAGISNKRHVRYQSHAPRRRREERKVCKPVVRSRSGGVDDRPINANLKLVAFLFFLLAGADDGTRMAERRG